MSYVRGCVCDRPGALYCRECRRLYARDLTTKPGPSWVERVWRAVGSVFRP